MILSTVESDRSFLIWSCVYPAIGVLFGIAMIILYIKFKEKNLIKPFLAVPILGLVYGVVYTSVYCAVTLKQGGFTYIYVIRSFEGFAIDFIVWICLFIHSSVTKRYRKDVDDKKLSSKLSEDEKVKISNF
ncbi:MAG: hypothetical protein PUH11_01030 [Bacilli bacterium]|nr:hypothetical protein [Mollicutes bacterium]MDD7314298.1 hypothetical protein [Bacilli bacterium]MDY3903751.1 hypothetical protein [Candidatus Enteromonas sp.]MCI7058256.1 hypothetical protein [Mollicutes bacterium]MDY4052910.1 hypothetical protein [Bacilli bacterium]